jgi:hypothetical protein
LIATYTLARVDPVQVYSNIIVLGTTVAATVVLPFVEFVAVAPCVTVYPVEVVVKITLTVSPAV